MLGIQLFQRVKANKALWNSGKILLWILLIPLTEIVKRIFDPLLDKLQDSFPHFSSKIVSFLQTNIPIYSLFVIVVMIWVFFRVYNHLRLSKSKLIILDAKYRKNEKYINITNQLNNRIVNNRLAIILSNDIGGDPLYGVVKEAKIKYRHNGRDFEKSVKEYEIIDLP